MFRLVRRVRRNKDVPVWALDCCLIFRTSLVSFGLDVGSRNWFVSLTTSGNMMRVPTQSDNYCLVGDRPAGAKAAR